MSSNQNVFLLAMIVVFLGTPFLACLGYKVTGMELLVPLGLPSSILLMTSISAYSIFKLGVSRTVKVALTLFSFVVSLGANLFYFALAIGYSELLETPPIDLM